MPTKTSGANDYAIGGCSQEIAVMGALVRGSLSALRLPHEIYKVRLRESAELEKLIRAMRRGHLAAVCLSGAMCHEAFRLADHASTGAARSRCADTLMAAPAGVLAANTFFDTCAAWLASTVSRRSTAVVVGSGARACAVVAACQAMEFQIIGVTSRSWSCTEALHESPSAERIRKLGGLPTLWPGTEATEASSNFSREMRLQFSELARSANVLIQTVAVDPSTEDVVRLAHTAPWSEAQQDAVVCDLLYGPVPGPYLIEAERHGLHRVGGVEMLTRRGIRLIETWTGQCPPRAPVHATALRACMRSKG